MRACCYSNMSIMTGCSAREPGRHRDFGCARCTRGRGRAMAGRSTMRSARSASTNREGRDWPRFGANSGGVGRRPCWTALARTGERLAARLVPAPAAPPAAFLHGDLWTGNILVRAARGGLIDPACYHGDARSISAMLEPFLDAARGLPRGLGPRCRAGRSVARSISFFFPALALCACGAGYQCDGGPAIEAPASSRAESAR